MNCLPFRTWLRDLRVVGLFATALCIARPASAQVASKFSSAILSGWSAGISANGGYEDGIQLVLGQPVTAYAFGANANAAKLWRTRHDRVEVSAGAGLRQYPTNPILDQRTYDFGGSVLHTFTRTTTAQVGLNASSFFVDRAITGAGPGVALGRLVNVRTQTASALFGTQIRRGYTASLTANRQVLQTSTVGLFPGVFASVGANLAGQLSRATSINVGVVSQYSRFDTNEVTLPRIIGTASYTDPFGFSASFTGSTVMGSAAALPLLSRLGLGLSVGFRTRLGQFSGDLTREVGQAFGFVTGIQVTSSAAMGYSKQITRALTTSARGSIGRLSTVEAGAPSTAVSLASAGMSLAIARGATISLSAFASKFGNGTQTLNGKGVSTSMSYGWAQQRRGDPSTPR